MKIIAPYLLTVIPEKTHTDKLDVVSYFFWLKDHAHRPHGVHVTVLQVVLEQGAAGKAVTGHASTDGKGALRITVAGATSTQDVVGAYITIQTSPSCRDAATGLPLPIQLGALVDIPDDAQGKKAACSALRCDCVHLCRLGLAGCDCLNEERRHVMHGSCMGWGQPSGSRGFFVPSFLNSPPPPNLRIPETHSQEIMFPPSRSVKGLGALRDGLKWAWDPTCKPLRFPMKGALMDWNPMTPKSRLG